MDDTTNPGGNPNPPNDSAQTRRMDTPAEGVPAQPDYGNQGYGAQPYGPPAQPQQPQQPYQYAPPPTYPAAQPYQYNAPQQYTPQPLGAPGSSLNSYAANPPVRDPMLAMIIEMIGGFLGFMGIGNMLAGRLVPGLVLLVSWWIIIGVGFSLLTFATCGLGLCLVIPMWLAGPILSGLYLRGEMTGQPLLRR